MSAVMVIVLLATLFIAFANGANDNFKGVATLFGSGTTRYRQALAWATLTTFLGSIAAFFLAQKLIKTFSGKGLVPDAVIQEPVFLLAVILGAGLTVLFTACLGIPVSTTHSLTGALVGAGFAAIGFELAFRVLGKNFFIPLLVSPFLALTLTALFYTVIRFGKQFMKARKETCICIGERVVPVANAALAHGQVLSIAELKKLEVFVDEREACEAKAVHVYSGNLFGFSVQSMLDGLHFLSAGAVSFARGLNDTPKIVALSVAAGALGLQGSIFGVALAMMAGGWLLSRRIAETMAQKITPMSHGQGLMANLVTAFLVIVASRMGVPVSTTHVSCGSIFGIGIAGHQARGNVITGIVGAWVLTLPVAAAASGFFYLFLSRVL